MARVLSLRSVGEDAVVLRLALPEPPPRLRAGRFFMLRRLDCLRPAIPRPFSVYRQLEDGSLEFLIKLVGEGTRSLAAAELGAPIRALGPLGQGWPSLDPGGPPWVLLAGGIGSAPFYMAIEQARAMRSPSGGDSARGITLIYGAARAAMLYELERFEGLGPSVLAATDDGSRGFHGNILELLEAEWAAGRLPQSVRLCACGPEPMMAAVARTAEERGLDCWLSLETLMGCGVGICNGCAVLTRPDGPAADWPLRKCCVDGPVFAASAIRL